MTVANIKTRWLRRTVLVLVSIPIIPICTVLTALLGINEHMGELLRDMKATWRA